MGSEWSEKLLEDLADEVTVGFVGSMTTEYVEDGIPFFRSKNVSPYRINWDDVKYVSREFHQKIKKSTLRPGDVVIVRTGKPGTACIIPEDITEANCSDLVIVRPGKNLDKHFLVYYLNSAAAHHISSHLVGAVQQHFNVGAAKKISIPLPPLPEQKAIAHILGSLDDKIELNRKMNATLEGMAQALFKSWFVDFDPVIDNALAAGNPIPDELADRAEVRKNLSAEALAKEEALANGTANREAAKHFPANFQQTESMGWIPEGWEVLPLDQVADFKNGLALQKFRPKSGEIPLPIVKIAQLQTGDPTWDELASPSISPYCIIDDGDVVFSWSGSLIIDIWCGGKAALNQHLFKVISNDFPKWFYFKWSKEHLNNFQKIAADKAVTMGHIKRSHLSEALCVVPSKDLIKIGSDHFDPILERIIRNRLHSRWLTGLRDTLLPKLISGELRIPEAEQLTEEVLA
jgi:type I restriction enzyme S subunit